MQRAQLRVRRTAPDARVHEIAPARFDREATRVAGEPFGGLAAERPGALDKRRLVVAQMHDQRRRAAPHTTTLAAAAVGRV